MSMMAGKLPRTYLIATIFILVNVVHCIQETAFLNKCISSKNHKSVPGPEGSALKSLHCQPWNKKSCCTWNTTNLIDRDGTLSLHSIVLDQCPQKKKLSEKCKNHFIKDTCFYECSPNLGPWIVADKTSKKTRKERIVNVPLCASDCITWYHDCLFDYTCNDNWGMGWVWKKKGSPDMCPPDKKCKTFGEYFSDPKEFCEKIFNYSFSYETETDQCMNLSPIGFKNENVAKNKAAELASKYSSGQKRRLPPLSLILCISFFVMFTNFISF